MNKCIALLRIRIGGRISISKQYLNLYKSWYGAGGGGTKIAAQAQEVQEQSDSKQFKRNKQPSTVLFVEFSKGGSLQKAMRAIVDRLEALLGFSIRVTERGGTPLSSLLSNKSLWRGQECGRGECKICIQPGERLEDCKRRNIYMNQSVYSVTALMSGRPEM